MVSDIKIRKGKISDIPQLIKLYANVKEIADFAGQKYDRNYFTLFIKSKDYLMLVADKKGEICGALNAEFEDMGKYTFVNNMVVSKKHRNLGIGRILMKTSEILSKKRKIKQMFGLVYDWNKNMQKVMKHFRYSVSGKMFLYSKNL